ncbi:MAG: hypoxanthine phosphoribosyltransferase [Armatimonadetes bacterium]|nr:hypoxanthine phosphoribosyltransferase [Armatimonadota bacterium]
MPYCDEDIIEVIITQQQIAARIAQLAQQIAADYRDKQLVLIGVLTGSFVFLSDLMRQLDRPCEVDFLDASSYGNSTVSRGEVWITRDLKLSLTGKDVLVIEDIVDSGRTVSELVRQLQGYQPASVKVCTLIDKHARREIPVELSYIGFVIPDQFVVGYGLDYAQCFRNLPFVAVLDEDAVVPKPRTSE